MALPERLKFGIFMAPFHRINENPTLALERDLELVQWLDTLGFDEVWVGEHHSLSPLRLTPQRSHSSALKRLRVCQRVATVP